MPAYRSVRRYNRVPRGGGAVRNLARGMGYAWRNRRAIVKAGRSVGQGLRNYFGSGNTTTAQRDIRSQRAPRKKPVNKRFTRKVENVISSHAGRNTVVFSNLPFASTIGAGVQAIRFFTLFGANGLAGSDSDINKILTLHEDPADVEDPESKNLFFNYGVAEVGFTNRVGATSKVVIEIYEWKVRRNATTFNSASAMETSNEADEDLLTDPAGPIQPITMTTLGVSPYQIPDLCKNLKFGKKTTIQLAPGGYSTYTLARKRNRWISGLKVRDTASFAMPGWTEGILMVMKGVPANGAASAASNIDFDFNRKYSWRAMDPDAKNEYMRTVW